MIFDSTIHLGDVITTLGVAGVGFILRGVLKPITSFVERVKSYDKRIEDTAEVVDVHSDIMKQAGWSRTPLKMVSHKRRFQDEDERV